MHDGKPCGFCDFAYLFKLCFETRFDALQQFVELLFGLDFLEFREELVVDFMWNRERCDVYRHVVEAFFFDVVSFVVSCPGS